MGSDFASGSVPTPPSGPGYSGQIPAGPRVPSFRVCTVLGAFTKACTSTNTDCYCVSSAQGTFTAPTPVGTCSGSGMSNISSGTPGSTSATITWNTTVSAAESVNYGTSIAYGTIITEAVGGTNHSVDLTGLAAGTLYHYVVSSSDGLGGTDWSGDCTFTTAP